MEKDDELENRHIVKNFNRKENMYRRNYLSYLLGSGATTAGIVGTRADSATAAEKAGPEDGSSDDVGTESVIDLDILDPTEQTEYTSEVDVTFRWQENHVYGPYRSVISIGSESDPEVQRRFVYEPGEDIRDGTWGTGEYIMTEVLEVPDGVSSGPHDLTVRVEENWPPGSDWWGFDQVQTVEDVVLFGAESRFQELQSAKMEMAGQIESISETIHERERIRGLLGRLESAIEDDGLDPSVAEDSVERMIRGEDLTEVSLASLTPVTVSSPESSPSRVGEPPESPAADDSVDIVGQSISLGVGALASLILGLKALRGLSSIVKRLLDYFSDAMDVLDALISLVRDAIPFIEDLAEDDANDIADDTEEMIVEDEEEDGQNIADHILKEIRKRYRDPLVARYMSWFEGGFEAELREFDSTFEPDSDGTLELSGSNEDAMNAADGAKSGLILEIRRINEELDALDLVVELSDYLAAVGVLLIATGVAAKVGAAAGLISQVMGITMGGIGFIRGFGGTFSIRSRHNDGLNAIATGGV